MNRDVHAVLRVLGWFLALLADEIGVAFLLFLVLPSFGFELPTELKIVALGLLGGLSAMVYRAVQSILMPPLVGAEAMIGAKATAITPLTPVGKIRICGEIWTAKMELGTAEPGEDVTIKKVTGLSLLVRKTAYIQT